MRQIIAAVIRKLLLTIFAPVTVGLLITASASAEPKGSFELSATMANIAMVNVEEDGRCDRNGDIGMSSAGLILSCQSTYWRVVKASLQVRAVRSGTIYYRGSTYAGCSGDEVVVGGGGYCDWSQGFAYSLPSGNGWTSGCMENVKSYSWAMCAKK